MKLLPIPGAPGYRVDCENQIAYRFNGYLKKINGRTKYGVVNIQVDGQKYVTTVFRMMYCAQHGIDITKIPKGVNISMRNGIVEVLSRDDINRKRFTTIRTRQKQMEQWKRNTELINRYYDGNTKPMLDELQKVEKSVKYWFIDTYGLCEERAEIVAAYGVNRYLDRLAKGFPSPYIMGSVIRYGRGENARLARQNDFIDNMQVIEV